MAAKTPLEIASYARQFTKRSIRVLDAIQREPSAPHASRVAAAVALLNRGHGTAPVNIQGEITHRYVVEMPADLTEDEWIQQYSTPMIESKDE